MLDIVTVGNLCIDSINLPSRKTPFVVLGGSAAYVSLASRRFESRVALVSKVGGDFPEAYKWWLGQEGIDLSGLAKVEGVGTARFELKYNGSFDRSLFLKSKGPPIAFEDFPKEFKAMALHVAPIANEIPPDVVEKLKSCAQTVSLDPQGLVRGFDEKGEVTETPLKDSHVLDHISIYKSSLAEIRLVTGKSELSAAIESVRDHGVETVIVTLGADGIVLSSGGALQRISACNPARIVDPTGAGDAFIGGFLSEYIDGENILRCACVGSATASFVVEGIGPTYFGDKTQVYQRARELYEKGIKQ